MESIVQYIIASCGIFEWANGNFQEGNVNMNILTIKPEENKETIRTFSPYV